MKKPLLVLAALLLALPESQAQTSRYQRELHGIKGADDRIEVAAAQYPWSAIGRLNNGLGGHCSAVMVGPSLLATAAHCLWNRRTRKIIPAESLTFVAGYNRGAYLKAAKVRRLHPAPGWAYDGNSHDRLHDWALLELAEPLGEQVGWVALGDQPRQGMAVTAAGYGKDKAHIPTAHLGCRLVSDRAGVFFHDCDAVQGDSGGPVLAWQGGEPRLVALNVAVIVSAGGLGVAVGVDAFRTVAERLGAAGTSRPGPLSQPLDASVKARAEAPSGR